MRKVLTLGDLRKAMLGLKDNTEIAVFYDGTFEENPDIYVDRNGTFIIDCEGVRLDNEA